MKEHTKKQITDAIIYWQKQLKMLAESAEGIYAQKLKKIKHDLDASKGKTPSDATFIDDKVAQQLEPKEMPDGSIAVDVEEGGAWRSLDSKMKNVNKSWTIKMHRDFKFPGKNIGDLVHISPDASFVDLLKLDAACNFTSTSDANGHFTKEAQKWTPEEQNDIIDILKGKTVSGSTLQSILNAKTHIKHMMKDLNAKERNAHSKHVTTIAYDSKGPFTLTANTTNDDIIGWICKLYGCKDKKELYNELVPDDVQTFNGERTAVDDFDEFRASYQDMISQNKFIDELVQKVHSAYNENDVISGSSLSNTVDTATHDILDDAYNDFEYHEYLTYKGHDDVYYENEQKTRVKAKPPMKERHKLNEFQHDGRHIPTHPTHRNPTDKPTVYYVAVDYSPNFDYGQYVTPNGNLTRTASNNDFKGAAVTKVPEKALQMAEKAAAKYGKEMYVFLFKEEYSYGVQTHKSHARSGLLVDKWYPNGQYWKYGLSTINEKEGMLNENGDFSNANALKMSCRTNSDFDETFYKYQVEEELKELGISGVSGNGWIEYVLDHTFIDENGWTSQLADAFMLSNVKKMQIAIGNDIVTLEKI